MSVISSSKIVGWAKRSVPTIRSRCCGETVGTSLRAFAHPTISVSKASTGVLPPPLWGRVGEGGGPGLRSLLLTPLPDRLWRSDLPHKGGGDRGVGEDLP